MNRKNRRQGRQFDLIFHVFENCRVVVMKRICFKLSSIQILDFTLLSFNMTRTKQYVAFKPVKDQLKYKSIL